MKRFKSSFSFKILAFDRWSNLILPFLFFILSVMIIEWGRTSLRGELREGDIAPSSIYAPVSFTYKEEGLDYLQEIKKNELIIEKGTRVTAHHLAMLKGLEIRLYPYPFMRIKGISGTLLLVLILLIQFYFYLKFYETQFKIGTKHILIIGTITLIIIFLSKLIIISPFSSTIIPISISSMLLAILLYPRVAIVYTVLLSILIGTMAGQRLEIVGHLMIGGIIGIFSVRKVRRRSQLLKAGVFVGIANLGVNLTNGLLNNLQPEAYLYEGWLGLINGLVSGIVVTGILPIFENLFKITTDISLVELSDLNHPILKEMVIKAPGTYHHSLVVGNLAEAACEAIGANPLLARVGGYFHDIGKIEKAEYFSENQSAVGSRHDKLSPTMSSLIITNHVKIGVDLAQQFRLNKEIMDIVQQHHGTGLVFYFYQRALEETEDQEIKEEGFRYQGPKPQTKEAACVLLADACEAASRSLEDPNPSRLENLVRKIINNKFIDGQLDECDLTLKDLEKIATVFIRILTGIYHARVEYPEKKDED